MNSKAYSLNIGLNKVDTDAYDGDITELETCITDAHAMEEIAFQLDYTKTKLLLEENATRSAFFKNVEEIRDRMNPGDLFLLTFSGHGSQVVDENGDEPSGYDQTWCFYDGQVIDDEIHGLLKTFKKGHRILILSDSCFSGEIIKDPNASILFGQTKRINLTGVEASVRLIAGCQENEPAKGSRKNGLFTEALLKVWNNGAFSGAYQAFYNAIVSEIPFNGQTPNHLIAGPLDEEFDKSKPFMV